MCIADSIEENSDPASLGDPLEQVRLPDLEMSLPGGLLEVPI